MKVIKRVTVSLDADGGIKINDFGEAVMSQLYRRKGTGSVLAWRNDGRWSKGELPAWVTEGRKLGSYGGTAYVYAKGGDLAVVCHPGQWLVKDEFGKIFVMGGKEFAERYEEG